MFVKSPVPSSINTKGKRDFPSNISQNFTPGFPIVFTGTANPTKKSLSCHKWRESDWLGWQDLNLRMPESKSGALPLGYSPIERQRQWRPLPLSKIMGWIMRFELTASRATIWRSNQLSYIHHIILVRLTGIEPATYCLEGSCSIQLSYKRKWNKKEGVRKKWSGWWESNPHNQLGRLGFYHWTTPAGFQRRS